MVKGRPGPRRQEKIKMATPTGRPTYGGWLDQIAAEGRTDDFGLVAAAWSNAQANGRPKYHAPKSVNRWLSEHAPPGVGNLQQTLHQLEQHYHNQSGLPDAPGHAAMPGAHAALPEDHQHAYQQPAQAADQAEAEQDWFTSPAGQAWLASPEGQAWLASQHPVSAGQEPVQGELYPDPAADPAIMGHPEITGGDPLGEHYQCVTGQEPPEPEHPYQVILLAIGRLQQQIDGFWQAMAPLIELAAESARVDAAIDASQLAQPSAAQQRALEIAQQQGWTPGPAIPQPPAPPQAAPDFYGQHVVPQPDFGRLAAEAQDE
jgi:hypothetical protein